MKACHSEQKFNEVELGEESISFIVVRDNSEQKFNEVELGEESYFKFKE